jgi:hypothetical protein
VTAERLGEGEAVEPRQMQIGQDQVRWVSASLLERMQAVRSLRDLELGRPQIERAQHPDRGVVIDEQHTATREIPLDGAVLRAAAGSRTDHGHLLSSSAREAPSPTATSKPTTARPTLLRVGLSRGQLLWIPAATTPISKAS